MELRHLITFKTIVDVDGFKKAADKLGYAQSSVTAHIKELEEELEKPLFDRLGRKTILTQAGRDFYPYAIEIIDLYAKSKSVVSEGEEPSGPLTIGASESLMVHWLPELIMEFAQKYPKVELTLKSLQYENLTSQLKSGDIDIAMLVEMPHWQVNELQIDQIREERLCFITSGDKRERMLVTEYRCGWRPIIEDYIKKTDTSMSRIELPSLEAIKKSVMCGLGVSMLPYFVVKDELNKGKLEEIKQSISQLGIYTAVHKDKWLSKNMKAFLQVLNNQGEDSFGK
ncbi:DNA-binding transcriptional regulator, LysR family [Gracilibacillus orientalis]|uniref:DNA-binding transcriptional regulator, LysR family n=1 Tax=Gracilibacillus orientalis TaxID=334253 RepID=A0A1I4Q1D5_9BACI|nr:LysR family transcriptional regulator [Gracilibacillus orientalis]SFM33869.1 DNA-binding transcriptional regulator, LysR family [Gracilibacillus orientalis]